MLDVNDPEQERLRLIQEDIRDKADIRSYSYICGYLASHRMVAFLS